MIQRVQTIYLLFVIILLSLVTFGMEIVSFVGDKSRFTFSSYGILEVDLNTGLPVKTTNWPIYIGFIALILLTFACLMSYKNLNRQFKLGRTVFGLYFLIVLSAILVSTMGERFLDVEAPKREMGIGFLLLIAGLPFTFLANIGIKRDKKLLDSLDRLR